MGVRISTALTLALFTVALPLASCTEKPPAPLPEHIPTPPPPEEQALLNFSLPAPRASSDTVIPPAFLIARAGQKTTLGSVADRIIAALENSGYYDKKFLQTPGGFAIVTRLERINADGSFRAQERFNVDRTLSADGIFSLRDYINALFTSNPGYYRIIVFVVTNAIVTDTAPAPTPSEAVGWLGAGGDILPSAIRKIPFETANDYHCTALIYEFQHEEGHPPVLLQSAPQAESQLRLAGVWSALGG